MTSVSSYASFMHGQSVHHHSIIYGAFNDVVLHQEVSSASESEDDRRRRFIQPLTPINMPGHEQRPALRQRRSDGEAEGVVVEPGSRKRAGVRRRRRFANDYFLDPNATRPTNIEEARQEWHSLYTPETPTVLQQLFEDPQAAARFRPFVGVTMEKEEQLLGVLEPKAPQAAPSAAPTPTAPTHTRSAAHRFSQIPRDLRAQLWHAAESDLLDPLQGAVVQYLQTTAAAPAEAPPLELRLPRAYDRLLLHGVAIYYNVHSYSMDAPGGPGRAAARCTYVRRKRGDPTPLPSVPLVEFLSGLSAAAGYYSYGPSKPCKPRMTKKYRRRPNAR